MADNDRQGSKPYKTYKAGHGKRRALDDELAGGAPPKYLVQVAADAARWIADAYRQEISETN